MKHPFFTVFSGTYNSEDVIHRLFDSVLSQSFKDFEWIIIDDNSSDNTVSLITSFLEKNSHINARLIVHECNTGIAQSRFEALELAQGEYFVKWDHDDINHADQLEAFYDTIKKYPNENVGAIWCLCEDQHEVLCGNLYPDDEHIGNYFSLYSSHIMGGLDTRNERHNCIKTKVHQQVVSELYTTGLLKPGVYPDATSIWAMLSMLGYKIVFINKRLRRYFIETDRQSMSRRGRRHNVRFTYEDRKRWVNIYSMYLPAKDFMIVQRAHFAMALYGILSDLPLKGIVRDADRMLSKALLVIHYIMARIAIRVKKI